MLHYIIIILYVLRCYYILSTEFVTSIRRLLPVFAGDTWRERDLHLHNVKDIITLLREYYSDGFDT